MPPRKSNISMTSTAGGDEAGESTPAAASKSNKDGLGVDDLSLPKSMIARLAKGVLPANTQIHRDALLALHKSATVFVSYIASNSNDLAQAGGKKTISPQDVMASIRDAELEGFLPRLEAELKKYNEMQCDKRNSYRHRVKQERAAAQVVTKDEGETSTVIGDDSMYDADAVANGHAEGGDGERPSKKLKGSEGLVVLPSAAAPLDDDDDHDMDEADQDEVDEEAESENEDEIDEDEEDEVPDVDASESDEVFEHQDAPRDEALDEHDSD